MSETKFELPSVEEQERLVKWADEELRSLVNDYFPKGAEEHKPFRFMAKQLMPQMRDSPASSKTDYHSAWPGGMLVHTVMVMQMGLKLTEFMGSMEKDSGVFDADINMKRSALKCCYLHDLGKLGEGADNPYYLEQENEWRKDNLGEQYVIQRDMSQLTYLPIPVRALWLAQKFGVYLTPAEVQAIVASDGPGTPHGKQVISTFLEEPLTAIVHFADKWVSQVRGV